MIGITPKQMSLRTTIDEFVKQHGYSPSVAELAVLQGTVKSNIVRMINDLEKRGHVTRIFGKPRSVMVVPIGEQQ
tara:strand:- start:147 stop:371 length:225 start_codon:yes stop_codon:yes gene_type:complete